MASRALGGIVFLKIDGTQYLVRGNWKVAGLTTMKTGVAGMDGVHGYLEKPQVPSIEGDVSDYGGLSIAALQNITNSTATLELSNGKVYVATGCWYASGGDLDTAQAQTTLKLEAMSIVEQLATTA